LIQKIGQSYPDVSEPLVKQLITLPSTISMIVGLLAGQLVRFFSKRGIIITGLVLFTIGGIGAFWIPSFGVHVALRCILGAGIGLVTPLSLSLIGDFFVGDERASMIGGSLAFSKIFAIMVPPLAALLAAKNWQNVYFMYFVSVGILVYIILTLKSPKKADEGAEIEKTKSKIPPVTIFLALGQFALLAIYFVLVTDLSYMTGTKSGASPILSGFGLSMATIGTFLAGLTFSKFYGVIKNWVIPTSFVVMGVGFLIVTHSTLTTIILLGLMLAGFGVGILMSLVNLLTTNAVGDADSTAAMSLVTCATSLGVFASPFFYSWNPARFANMSIVESNFQTAGLLYILLGIASLILIVSQLMRKLRKTGQQDTTTLQGEVE
jgi:predicted MFS family arabinose efflux permease